MTIEEYARAIAEAVMVEVRYIAKDAYREFPWDNIDAIIASVPKPDVQAQEEPSGVCEGCFHAESDHTVMGCADCECKLLPVQAQIDAAYGRGYASGEHDAMLDSCNAIDVARADEREACARIVEEWRIPNALDGSDLNRNELLDDLADDIRARSGARGEA